MTQNTVISKREFSLPAPQSTNMCTASKLNEIPFRGCPSPSMLRMTMSPSARQASARLPRRLCDEDMDALQVSGASARAKSYSHMSLSWAAAAGAARSAARRRPATQRPRASRSSPDQARPYLEACSTSGHALAIRNRASSGRCMYHW